MSLSEMIEYFNTPPSEMIRRGVGSYLIINAVSRRARELQLGERALALPSDGSRDAVKIAQQELLEDKVEILPKEHSHKFIDLVNREEE